MSQLSVKLSRCLKLQLHSAIYRLRFYSNSLIHILSLSNSHNDVTSIQKNRGDKSHSVIVAFTMWETQFSSFDHNLFQTATSVNQLGFFWYPDARFRLIFFRKDFLNSLPHKLTSDWTFAVSFLEGKRGMNCDVRVAVHVVGILNSLISSARQQ